GGAQVLAALNAAAEAAGLRRGQPLRDATAMCPGLMTRAANPLAEADFLTALRRWAGKFSPWVAEEAPESLVIDLTGCAHLFGGEAGLLAQVAEDCADLRLTVRAAVADTRGAAWALARFGGTGRAAPAPAAGPAIRAEARATRSRAAATPRPPGPVALQPAGLIAPPGQTRQAIGALPVAALRLAPATVEGLARLGLRRIDDLAGLPRAALARRFGTEVLRRLDQALGLEPEPVAPAAAPPHFAVRLTLPEPIGLRTDVDAAVDRLLGALCGRVRGRGEGARRVPLEGRRGEGGGAVVEVGLARAADTPDRIRPVLAERLDGLEAGFGFDVLRLSAPLTEPLHARQTSGHAEAAARALRGTEALDDLIGKLGARLGMEAVMRLAPAESHIPEKGALVLTAAFAAPHPGPWPPPGSPRPLVLFRPEPVQAEAPASPRPPAAFRWRRRAFDTERAEGPERIAPEWWLDDPDWRSGPRDYWRVQTGQGDRLWLFFAHGGAVSGGWFCQGAFA
ncbi:MAG TPA: DNA polymerase Y family protein, partial [Paracoccaceae bacterium]|nr:DNA polymerase Y family protein [Paracoccaceae bacterium]